jgi:CelD/BcsL family acetyltransferase involved in cellulose biosynthesis
VERACAAIFQALPDTRRIHMDVTCPPGELAVPVRFLFRRDCRYIEIPGGPDEYTASLGKHTRRNLRSYERRWSRDHPGADIRIVRCEGCSEELFEPFCTWKRARFAERGKTSHWDEVSDSAQHYTALLAEGGEAQVVSIDGECVGTTFFFHVGATLESQEAAYDTRFEPYALGTLMHYWTVLEAARRGCARVNLGPGPNEYFERFGSSLCSSYRISVFRSELARLDSLGEAAETGRRRLRLGARSAYWKSRHNAGSVLRKIRRSSGTD